MAQLKIALAGNPNSGKTTLFNALTGASQYVGNWPGVTVEKKEGRLKGNKDVIIQDLPGIYSLSPYTLEEVVSRNYLVSEKPDALINLVDGSNIERNLYLTTQLLELGIPIVIALNMMDIVRKTGDIINVQELEKALGCPIVEISALKNEGTQELTQKAVELATAKKGQPVEHTLDATVEKTLTDIEALIKDYCETINLRWYAVKLFEKDMKVNEQLNLQPEVLNKTMAIVGEIETAYDDDCESIITSERYNYITDLVEKNVIKKQKKGELTTSDKIDQIVTNRWLALPIFVIAMWAVYYISITTIGSMGTDWVNDVLFGEVVPGFVGGLLESWAVAPWLQSLILDGCIAGVGAILGFLPQMMVLFICLAILEDCGYMARIAFILDRIFRRFGLSGKSFIPMLIGMGCGVPAILASRTIENEKDRRMTVMVTTFVPCGAKLPVIALIAGSLFSDAAWVTTSAYFMGIGAILLSATILKKTSLFSGDTAPFVMELPAYHMPTFRNVSFSVWERTKSFVKKAGSIIFVACGLIWFLSSFGFDGGAFGMVDADMSLLADFGKIIAPIFAPLGFGNWQAAVATLSGLVAKEIVVGTLGVLLTGMAEVSENGAEIWPQMAMLFSQVGAYSFLMLNLLCAPCFAAIGAIRREMGDAKWTLAAIAWQCGLAYVVSFIIYQIGIVLVEGSAIGIGTILAVLCVIGIVYLLVRPAKESTTKTISAVEAHAKAGK